MASVTGQTPRGPALAEQRRMDAVFAICMFALDRVRTVLLALSLIIMVKIVWLLIAA
ncbi:MAG: hypothetical protein KJZ75_16645 [Hyphomonadaceae bacterium]|nr:hypothetical protein [Hyphomonadaceae bacterium]